MVKFFKTPFANNGDKLNIPEELQEDGSISFDQGYGEDYEKNRKTDPDAKNISRQSFNGLLHDITDAIGDIQRSGVAKWSDEVTYNKGSLVWHNKSLYSSLLDSNKSQPPSASWATLLTEKSLDLTEYRKKDDLSYEDGRLLTNKEIINDWDQASDENVFSAGFVSKRINQDADGNTIIKNGLQTFTFPSEGGELVVSEGIPTGVSEDMFKRSDLSLVAITQHSFTDVFKPQLFSLISREGLVSDGVNVIATDLDFASPQGFLERKVCNTAWVRVGDSVSARSVFLEDAGNLDKVLPLLTGLTLDIDVDGLEFKSKDTSNISSKVIFKNILLNSNLTDNGKLDFRGANYLETTPPTYGNPETYEGTGGLRTYLADGWGGITYGGKGKLRLTPTPFSVRLWSSFVNPEESNTVKVVSQQGAEVTLDKVYSGDYIYLAATVVSEGETYKVESSNGAKLVLEGLSIDIVGKTLSNDPESTGFKHVFDPSLDRDYSYKAWIRDGTASNVLFYRDSKLQPADCYSLNTRVRVMSGDGGLCRFRVYFKYKLGGVVKTKEVVLLSFRADAMPDFKTFSSIVPMPAFEYDEIIFTQLALAFEGECDVLIDSITMVEGASLNVVEGGKVSLDKLYLGIKKDMKVFSGNGGVVGFYDSLPAPGFKLIRTSNRRLEYVDSVQVKIEKDSLKYDIAFNRPDSWARYKEDIELEKIVI